MLRSRLIQLTRIVEGSRKSSLICQNVHLPKTNNFTEFARTYSSSSQVFTQVPDVFERIKQVSNPSIVKKVNAVYVFDVEGEGKWHVDLTSGSGQIGQGAPANNPDVTVVVNKEIFLKMFNRELKPATAFMSGKLKLSGDLSKALALESVMKASRDDFQ
eukprot:TRINITY_DN76593_c0_g1_i1.p1 TRINITY_DN76593_c0_g1~~TRINITY_DN76593_c0_g1_i1.p1  ORF type:complete len:159 (+),score=36.63 TRINITY_DN76593_c0_g1_i1:31-507(+)